MQQKLPRARPAIVGKTVAGVISRPAESGHETLIMLQFTDGTCFEFVSPAALRDLRRTRKSAAMLPATVDQLSIFPQDGSTGRARPAPIC